MQQLQQRKQNWSLIWLFFAPQHSLVRPVRHVTISRSRFELLHTVAHIHAGMYMCADSLVSLILLTCFRCLCCCCWFCSAVACDIFSNFAIVILIPLFSSNPDCLPACPPACLPACLSLCLPSFSLPPLSLSLSLFACASDLSALGRMQRHCHLLFSLPLLTTPGCAVFFVSFVRNSIAAASFMFLFLLLLAYENTRFAVSAKLKKPTTKHLALR